MYSSDYISDLEARGVSHFTTQQAARELGRSTDAVQQALRRLRHQGRIATIQRGFHVTVPPEHRARGCRPASHFVPLLMEHLGLDYYVGLLSAAQLHGAAHHKPMVFQVVVAAARREIHCGKVRVHFVRRRNVAEMPVVPRNSRTSVMRVSSPEATAYDLVGYPARAAGLDNTVTVLTELAESLDAVKLAEIAPLSPVFWVQRLGFLLDFVGAGELTGLLGKYAEEHAYRSTRLSVRHRQGDDARYDSRWKVHVNIEPDPDV